jgi:hypothetical protein
MSGLEYNGQNDNRLLREMQGKERDEEPAEHYDEEREKGHAGRLPGLRN